MPFDKRGRNAESSLQHSHIITEFEVGISNKWHVGFWLSLRVYLFAEGLFAVSEVQLYSDLGLPLASV